MDADLVFLGRGARLRLWVQSAREDVEGGAGVMRGVGWMGEKASWKFGSWL